MLMQIIFIQTVYTLPNRIYIARQHPQQHTLVMFIIAGDVLLLIPRLVNSHSSRPAA